MDGELARHAEMQASVWTEKWTYKRRDRKAEGRKKRRTKRQMDCKREEQKRELTVKEKNEKANGL